MISSWQKLFSDIPKKIPGRRRGACRDADFLGPGGRSPDCLESLKNYLDLVHVKRCLARPYFEQPDYPLVEARELLPSFDLDFYEYKELPGFGMLVLDRQLSPFSEIFQFDILHELATRPDKNAGGTCPLENAVQSQNLATIRSRLPRRAQEEFTNRFGDQDVTALDQYPELMRYLLMLDRAHILARGLSGEYYLAGTYASFPCDLDAELKRFGLKIGKFSPGDNAKYELNRLFTYQFLMELYGFPIASERRTSAALFARRLFRMGEKFFVRALGQTDRVITTLSSHYEGLRYPRVEKLALVSVDKDQREVLKLCEEGGFFLDESRRTVILRIVYRQHDFNPGNVRQERALSVGAQSVIHPLTGRELTGVNVIKDASTLFLRLNDIVRGEYQGKTIFKRQEVVENTETHEKRLKFLYTWLSKHQRRIIGYSDDFYSKVVKVMDAYLLNPETFEDFTGLNDLYREVWSKYNYIHQARKVRIIEDLGRRTYKAQRIGYLEQLEHLTDILSDLKFEIVNYFDPLVRHVIAVGEKVLNDSYVLRTYVQKKDDDLKDYGLKIKKRYQRLVALIDEFKSIRAARATAEDRRADVSNAA